MDPTPIYLVRPPYRLRLWVAPVNGRTQVVGLEMWGTDPLARPWPAQVDPEVAEMTGWSALPDAPITPASLRLPIATIVREHRDHDRALLRAIWRELADAEPGEREGRASAVADALGALPEPHRGRPRLSDELLRLVADYHREASALGRHDPGTVVWYRLQRVTGRSLSRSTVRGWIRKARERGYLPAIHPEPATGPTAKRRARR